MRIILFISCYVVFVCTVGAQSAALRTSPKIITFVKSPTGKLIDSLVFRTSTEERATGISFRGDSLQTKIAVIPLVDELLIAAYADGNYLGDAACWIDEPAARIHLSVFAGRVRVDSVDRGIYHRNFQRTLQNLRALTTETQLKVGYLTAAAEYTQTIITSLFMEQFMRLPTFTNEDRDNVDLFLQMNTSLVSTHPYFDNIYGRLNILYDNRGVVTRRRGYLDPLGKPVNYELPKAPAYLVNFYYSTDPNAPLQHQQIQDLIVNAGQYPGLHAFSISTEPSLAVWKNYVRENRFSWPHLLEPPNSKFPLSVDLAQLPGNIFILLDKRRRPIGVYDSVDLLVRGLDHFQASGDIKLAKKN
ncbi:hypothetical protein [Neolewinella antarctica]|uniref:Uncharacterized protein n=1 Tax=Neolewinella antarctica TaxID=442734 RepID=A0ABX0XDM6_9BACT|nr:hypothetical protein [Neolewinella antarctica]NJC26999.1 hypothetical protein [Neolewinella antarctica]